MAEVKPKTRTVRLVRPPNADGVGVLCIDTAGKCQFYTFWEIRCEIGGRGFAVHRLGQGELYHVRVGAPEDTSCECMGFLRWGRCKHTAALAALLRKGELRRISPSPRWGEGSERSERVRGETSTAGSAHPSPAPGEAPGLPSPQRGEGKEAKPPTA